MKDEYISKQQALDELFCERCTYAATRVIKNIPPADVAPVVHGKNITKRHPVDEFVCSECGIILFDYERLEIDEDDDDENCYEYEFRFCPNCGAKMDEEAKE